MRAARPCAQTKRRGAAKAGEGHAWRLGPHRPPFSLFSPTPTPLPFSVGVNDTCYPSHEFDLNVTGDGVNISSRPGESRDEVLPYVGLRRGKADDDDVAVRFDRHPINRAAVAERQGNESRPVRAERRICRPARG